MKYDRIGIVIADEGEYDPFINTIKHKKSYDTPFRKSAVFRNGNSEVFAVCCGIGKVNAASAAMMLIERGCDTILNFGLSGGLSGVSRGRFILPDSFIEYDFDLTVFGYKPCEKPGQTYMYRADKTLIDRFEKTSAAKKASIAVCGDRFVNSKEDREFLINTFSASSCDMETAAIASVCHITDTPFVSLRRISDDASDNAAQSYDNMNANEGKTLAGVFMDCLNSICF